YRGVVLFVSHDHEFVDTVANRIIEFTPTGMIDRTMRFDDYLRSEDVRATRDQHYHGHHLLEI
ncbi:MAG: ABC transporter ATP-binding protein, partial [Spirochaetota bacterium]